MRRKEYEKILRRLESLEKWQGYEFIDTDTMREKRRVGPVINAILEYLDVVIVRPSDGLIVKKRGSE